MENFNAVTKHVYSLKNQAQLIEAAMGEGFTSNEWAGFKQWGQVGRKIKKGSKATKILMVVIKKREINGEVKEQKVLKTRALFNLNQTEKAE